MEKKKKTLSKEIEETMACSAFGEAGEPCPTHMKEQKDEPGAAVEPKKKKKTAAKTVEDTMACTAFAEAGEPCPIDNEQEKGKPAAKK